MKEIILAFAAAPILPILQMTFAPHKMVVCAVPDSDLAETVGALAGAPGYARSGAVYSGEALAEPMLVFCGFSDERMNLALAAMRKHGVKIPCKAMLTEYNCAWLPVDLLKELQEEHAAMAQGKTSR